MSEKRQKTWNKPASKVRVGSEAFYGTMRGSEAQMAINETESLAVTEQLMKEVLNKNNLEEALKQVMQNKKGVHFRRYFQICYWTSLTKS